jgi:hypothetical protein
VVDLASDLIAATEMRGADEADKQTMVVRRQGVKRSLRKSLPTRDITRRQIWS